MNFKIKKYIETDRASLLAVWERSVSATHHFLTQKDFDTIRTILQKTDFGALNVYCLMINNKVTGFISIIDRKIEMLFLDPGYIGMGLGKKMLHWALREHGACRVDVNEQNVHAVNFYKKSGFVVTERLAKDELGFNYPLLKMHLQQPDN